MKAFISFGRHNAALEKVEGCLRERGVEPVTAKEGVGVEKALRQVDFVIILATGDDVVEGRRYAHQNVAREVGLAEKSHAGRIVYLLEQNAVFPTGVERGVWERFSEGEMEGAFRSIEKQLGKKE